MSAEVQATEKGVSRGPFGLETKINYIVLSLVVISHSIFLYGLFTFPYTSAKMTILWCILVANIAKFGETAGAHRLWAHRSYKAKWPLRLFILLCFYTNGIVKVKGWAKLHRAHHKFTDTHADPHNTKRGMFYTHIGWYMSERHPELLKKIKQIDFSDLYEDPLLKYEDKIYYPVMLTLTFIAPAIVPVYFWNETWRTAFLSVIMRFVIVGNLSSTVNSIAHAIGSKPYDRNISSSENKLISILTLGEGWHNYHHTFPWDYKAAELPIYSVNVTTLLIDFFAKMGWAYDLKEPSPELVKAVCLRRGDGSHKDNHFEVPAPAS